MVSIRLRKLMVVLISSLALLVFPVNSVFAEEGEAAQKFELVDQVFDAAILRPLDAVALVFGIALMAPAAAMGLLPVTTYGLAGGVKGVVGEAYGFPDGFVEGSEDGVEGVQDSWDLLIMTSWESLVERPLGELESM